MTTLTLRPGNALERRRALAGLLGVSPALLAIGLFLVVPILIVAAYSLMQANPYGGVNHVFSSDAYVSLLFERQLDDSLAFADSYLVIALRSLGIATATTVITLLVGFPVAVWLGATRSKSCEPVTAAPNALLARSLMPDVPPAATVAVSGPTSVPGTPVTSIV